MLLNHARRAFAAVLLAIVLPATAQDLGPGAAAAAAAPEPVADMDNATTIWDQACAACHGELGQGSHGGVPDIRNGQLSLSQIVQVVKAGRNTMPAFAGFTSQELLDISTYVRNEVQEPGRSD